MSYVLIVSPARSASTSLRLTLNSAQGVLCHGELLGANRVLGVSRALPRARLLTKELREEDPKGFITHALTAPNFETFGFKALFGHFFLERNQPCFDWILARAPQVLFLWRENLVARYLSECRKRMLRPDRARPQRFARVSVADIAADAQHQMQMARDIRARLKATPGCVIHDITFEELVKTPAITHNAMASLGLQDSGYKIKKDQRTRRNEKTSDGVPTPDSFADPSLDRYRSITLEKALAAEPL